MRIAWLRADYLFPLTTGSRNRSYNLLKRICHDAEVQYIGYRPVGGDFPEVGMGGCAKSAVTFPKDLETTSGFGLYFRVALNLLTEFPYFIHRNAGRPLREEIARVAASGGADILVCDGLDASLNVDFTLPIPKVLYHHSLETPLWRQRYESSTNSIQKAYFNYETKRMSSFESEMCSRFDLIVTTSDNDKQVLQSEYHVHQPIVVVPIGVDCSYFKPDPVWQVVPHRLVFSGRMDLLSNIDQLLWFVSEIYPLVKRQFPDITFEIVGRNPAAEVLALALKDASIRVTGWVDDIRPHVAQADIYVVPLRVPGGTRVKLYEAMALRRPIVSTSYGAEGLEVVANRDLAIADTPREFAAAIIALLENDRRKEALAEQGWRLVNGSCDWSIRATQFLDVLAASLGAKTAGSTL